MKKIDKSTILSSNYKEWLDSLGEEHPKYNSSNNKYYNDIKMSLLYCQNGLCAYTEEELCDEDLIDINNWDNEKYIYSIDKNISLINGDLEHFNESLKDKKAWLWDNLFFVQGDINRKIKCSKSIQEILKPDAPHYDPNIYLEFDYKRNRFIANSNLNIKVQADVDCMIITLGLNANAFKRKRQINKLVKALKDDIELEEPHEYITAWNMTLKQLEDKGK